MRLVYFQLTQKECRESKPKVRQSIVLSPFDFAFLMLAHQPHPQASSSSPKTTIITKEDKQSPVGWYIQQQEMISYAQHGCDAVD